MPKFKRNVRLPGPPALNISRIRFELTLGGNSYWQGVAGQLVDEIDRIKIIMQESTAACNEAIALSDELVEDHKAIARMWHDKYQQLLSEQRGSQ
ncbi:hypothetical protein P4H71_06910 [Paenibacillus kribbensis]|uniref:hypothetical protein n=1 Tax=Paenibacillus kribbensis TaxID=172713 RepID=UPI002DBA327D|nr:hypothetical protein [Paenibacillus kribbensis]MEC0234060.1 hypothetical protein [Paenibacillus kribbensis]